MRHSDALGLAVNGKLIIFLAAVTTSLFLRSRAAQSERRLSLVALCGHRVVAVVRGAPALLLTPPLPAVTGLPEGAAVGAASGTEEQRGRQSTPTREHAASTTVASSSHRTTAQNHSATRQRARSGQSASTTPR